MHGWAPIFKRFFLREAVFSPRGREPGSYLREGGVMSDGMQDKVEGKLKETEGELTNDKMREKQGEAQQKVGDAKDKIDDMTDKDGDGN
jgi:uncharacterized protein YjbJ (UPF0337 family)